MVFVSEWYLDISEVTMPLFSLVAGWMEATSLLSAPANPNGIPTQTCHFHETLRLCSEMHHVSCATCHFHANHNVLAVQTDT